jgi:hypothetical protein
MVMERRDMGMGVDIDWLEGLFFVIPGHGL